MGIRGPAPTPTAILEARGSWRAAGRTGEPQPPRGKPPCPRFLTKPQRKVYHDLCRLLDQMGLLTVADGQQLLRYAVYVCRWWECEAFIAKNGVTYAIKSDDPNYYMARLPNGTAVLGLQEFPHVKESHRLDKALKQIEASFGLTPSARTRLHVPQAANPADDRKARFFAPSAG